MKDKHLHRSAAIFASAVLLFVFGCTGTSKPPKFYMLRALPESEAAGLKQGGVSVEVGPIIIPAYLDSTQIATAGDGHRIYTDQFNRWAEPLKNSFGLVLAENLAILLETVNVYIYPQRRDVSADFQVEITISRFYAKTDGTAVLAAYWSVIGDGGKTVMARRRSSITQQAASTDVEALVAAQNQTLEQFSREIAATIRNLK